MTPLVLAVGILAAATSLSLACLALLYVILFVALYRVGPLVAIAVGLAHTSAEVGSLLVVAAVGTAVVGNLEKPRIQAAYAGTVAAAAFKHTHFGAAAAGLLAVMHLSAPIIQAKLPPPKSA